MSERVAVEVLKSHRGSLHQDRQRCSQGRALKALIKICSPQVGVDSFAKGFTPFHWHLTRTWRGSLLFNITAPLAASLSSTEELLKYFGDRYRMRGRQISAQTEPALSNQKAVRLEKHKIYIPWTCLSEPRSRFPADPPRQGGPVLAI